MKNIFALISIILPVLINVNASSAGISYTLLGDASAVSRIPIASLPPLPSREEAPIKPAEQKRAVELFQEASNYENGSNGYIKDIYKAILALHAAAQYGEERACEAMAILFEEGRYGATRDPARAAMYINQKKYWPCAKTLAVEATSDSTVKPAAEDTSRRPW